ncbi:MAG: YraN family protein [Bacteroidales bacterium]|nr:YraN family protein [Bacteroidales bacterium]
MNDKQELGKLGENFALHLLVSKGFKILETNWRHRKDEVDIIAKDDAYLVIVEVKTRSTNYFGEPFTAVTKKKQGFLIRAANAYIEKNNIDLECRFDIISIVFAQNKHQVEHIEDAFYPE